MPTDFQNSFIDRLSSKCLAKRNRMSHHISHGSLHYLVKY